MRRSWRNAPLALAALLMLLLTACGTTEQPIDDTEPSAPTGERIVLTDARGKQVTLNGPARRTVALEWNLVEYLTSLGAPPVGITDIKGYSAWVSAVPLPPGVTDVGTRGEPSVEAIAGLRPDLVLASPDLPEGAVAQIETFAPVLLVRPANAATGLDHMRDNVRLVARAVGREAEADRLLADLDTAIAAGAARLAEAGLAGTRFAFADARVDSGRVSIRPFTEGSLVESVSERLGLVNAWPMPGDQDYGLANTDVEGLTALGDVRFFYWSNKTEQTDPFTTALADNAVWRSLPFVQRGHVTRIPDGIWLFGGPVSMRLYVDAVVTALTQSAR